jgi:ribosomal protein S15P/S13E
MHLSDHLHRNKVKDKLAVRKRDHFIQKRRKILLYLKRTVCDFQDCHFNVCRIYQDLWIRARRSV